MNCKYLVAKIDDEETIFVFPKKVDHDRMAEALEAIRFGNHSNWSRKLHPKSDEGDIIAAGFVTDGKTHGNSETLNLASRPEDQKLFNQLIGKE